MKFVVDNKIPFLAGVFEPFAEVTYLPGAAIDRLAVSHADALIVRTRTRCDRELLAGSRVQYVATATIGHDHIIKSDLAASGIRWINAPGCNASSVAQYVASALLTFAHERNLNLAGKTLGVVGVGHVGSKVARLGELLGMRILLNDPPRARREGEKGFVSLSQIIAEADVISLHVPLTTDGVDKTHHLVDDRFCAALERKPIFINTSRGEVVSSKALDTGLTCGAVTAAILDVWENEPTIDRDLLDAAAIATPHIAGYSLDGKAAATQMVVRAVGQFFSLPTDSFVVGSLPIPPDPKIQLANDEPSEQELMYQAIHHTYNIRQDDARLRDAPRQFEKLREGYPLRREPLAYHIVGGPEDAAWQNRLRGLGFVLDL